MFLKIHLVIVRSSDSDVIRASSKLQSLTFTEHKKNLKKKIQKIKKIAYFCFILFFLLLLLFRWINNSFQNYFTVVDFFHCLKNCLIYFECFCLYIFIFYISTGDILGYNTLKRNILI